MLDAVVIYYDTITKYRNDKCNAKGGFKDCFDGEEYFKDFILTHDGSPLFGDKSRRIKLDEHGDSTQRYGIYQLQHLAYHVTTLMY